MPFVPSIHVRTQDGPHFNSASEILDFVGFAVCLDLTISIGFRGKR